jgi:hypothetical protein
MDRFKGGCLRGNLRIIATGRPFWVGLCHCLDCRKLINGREMTHQSKA